MKKQVVMTSKGAVVVGTVKEAVELLKKDGIEVTQKAVLAGTVPQVQIVEESEVAAILAAANGDIITPASTNTSTEGTDTDTGEAAEDTDDTKVPDAVKDDDKPTPPPVSEDIEYPEVGHFKDEKAMKKYVKKVPDAALFEWCELEGATWKRCPEHAPIDRMRAAMALKAKHFPDTAPKASTKSKSKYADYATEDLVQMAIDNDIYVDGDNGDMRILRMKTIMALRAKGIIA